MTRLLAIAAGGAIGALLRFWVSTSMYALLGREFPYGTLVVNVLGCLLMGFLYVFMLERFASVEWRAALLIGLLGAFTTFSTFSLETLNLLQGGEQIKALLNIFVSVLVCLLATWLGMQLARQL
ncbi:MAG: fluoride efflux transporter CrcB [Candidatus Parabeggiatoa sp. nov. 2]|nr:MAG: camphor resistance protein CrcB [Beggiatoa sp. 4572_84]RKZ52460.1 MAG: fluoride efflux transporter CrcB [Gammaproteobacteria bacterium]HEC83657.1 fluoride efflux transporter CrcB [Thioploca sp.]